MWSRSIIRYANIAIELFGSFLFLIFIIGLILGESKKTRTGRIYIHIIINTMIVLLSDAAAWAFDGNPEPYAKVITHVANFSLFVFGYVVLAIFTNYLVTFISERAEISRRIVNIVYVLCGLAIALVIVSQFTNMYYYIDEKNIYRRENLFWVSQAYGVVGMVINVALCVIYRKSMRVKEFAVILLYLLFPIVAMFLQMAIDGLAILNIGMTISIIFIYLMIQVEQTREREKELSESKVAIMLSQIQPHFLYNSLTAISELCEDNAEAREALMSFSNYLRGNMDSLSRKELINFSKELEHVKNYLVLETLRFGDRVKVKYDIGACDFMLPALTLQPMVENAVRYGVTKKREGGTILIQSFEDEQSYCILVKDDGVGFDTYAKHTSNRTHIVISSVRGRLKAMCEGSLQVESEIGKGTLVTIKVPKNKRRSK